MSDDEQELKEIEERNDKIRAKLNKIIPMESNGEAWFLIGQLIDNEIYWESLCNQ